MAGREVREYTNLTDPKGIHSYIMLLYMYGFFLLLLLLRRFAPVFYIFVIMD